MYIYIYIPHYIYNMIYIYTTYNIYIYMYINMYYPQQKLKSNSCYIVTCLTRTLRFVSASALWAYQSPCRWGALRSRWPSFRVTDKYRAHTSRIMQSRYFAASRPMSYVNASRELEQAAQYRISSKLLGSVKSAGEGA